MMYQLTHLVAVPIQCPKLNDNDVDVLDIMLIYYTAALHAILIHHESPL